MPTGSWPSNRPQRLHRSHRLVLVTELGRRTILRVEIGSRSTDRRLRFRHLQCSFAVTARSQSEDAIVSKYSADDRRKSGFNEEASPNRWIPSTVVISLSNARN